MKNRSALRLPTLPGTKKASERMSFFVVEISGIEPLTCAALTPPIRQRRIYYTARGLRFVFTAQQSKNEDFCPRFFVVEISGIEPLTS